MTGLCHGKLPVANQIRLSRGHGVHGHTIRSAVFIASIAGLYISVAMLAPAAVDFYFGNPDWQVFAVSSFVVGAICLTAAAANRGINAPFSRRLGFLVVNLLWITLSVTGAIPFYLASLGLDMADALFEIRLRCHHHRFHRHFRP